MRRRAEGDKRGGFCGKRTEGGKQKETREDKLGGEKWVDRKREEATDMIRGNSERANKAHKKRSAGGGEMDVREGVLYKFSDPV